MECLTESLEALGNKKERYHELRKNKSETNINNYITDNITD